VLGYRPTPPPAKHSEAAQGGEQKQQSARKRNGPRARTAAVTTTVNRDVADVLELSISHVKERAGEGTGLRAVGSRKIARLQQVSDIGESCWSFKDDHRLIVGVEKGGTQVKGSR
jgi:hypothetical protein